MLNIILYKLHYILIVANTFVNQPTRLVIAAQGLVGPVQYSALVVPLVFAAKSHRTPNPKLGNAISDIDVMRNEQRQARIEFEDKPLVPRSLAVVREYPGYCTAAADYHVALARSESGIDLGAALLRDWRSSLLIEAWIRRQIGALLQPYRSADERQSQNLN